MDIAGKLTLTLLTLLLLLLLATLPLERKPLPVPEEIPVVCPVHPGGGAAGAWVVCGGAWPVEEEAAEGAEDGEDPACDAVGCAVDDVEVAGEGEDQGCKAADDEFVCAEGEEESCGEVACGEDEDCVGCVVDGVEFVVSTA